MIFYSKWHCKWHFEITIKLTSEIAFQNEILNGMYIGILELYLKSLLKWHFHKILKGHLEWYLKWFMKSCERTFFEMLVKTPKFQILQVWQQMLQFHIWTLQFRIIIHYNTKHHKALWHPETLGHNITRHKNNIIMHHETLHYKTSYHHKMSWEWH